MGVRCDKVIVGLGNPGVRYANNRHNIGFMVLDALARRRGLAFQTDVPIHAWVSTADYALVKPLTYMNRSGEALSDWAVRQGQELTGAADQEGVRPLIVCDDLNLPMGSVRLRAGGRSGGQNGLASAIECLGGDNFPRLRLGIAPLAAPVPPEHWPEYVLADFTPDEADQLQDQVAHAVAALESWLENGLEFTISKFNRRIRPEEAG
ncbi:MAG: aminoacyl-tRNA hydrolase [Candidatus Krumholzibacteria bacterium]|nr:aminoacyl-tRNA hydrolase [Candidatus Krumholzibacteria bacterium]